MAKKANKTLIGAFVVGALGLIVVGILLFGGGRFFKENITLVAYFDGSVKGLGVGSKVQLKGVTVGEVKDVRLLFNPDKLSFINRVIMETGPGKISAYSDTEDEILLQEIDLEPEEIIDQLINRGLRARLDVESYVTGKLLVALDFLPESRVRMRGIDQEYIEIPTAPTELEKIAKKVTELPFEELVYETKEAIQGINTLVNSPELKGTLHALNQTLTNAVELVGNIDKQLGPIAASLDKTLKEYGKLAQSIDAHVGPLATSITATARDTQMLIKNVDNRLGNVLDSAHAALEQTERALVPIRNFASEDSSFRYNISQTLQEITEAARAVREFADYIERHPEALLRGKSASGER
ncbi:MAG: MCE family protein [Deltaproteobacteria bacterium]|jgi:paraquat-inducible protein B|nr:MCE family protein [Deltaproteobacteria bacterium]